MQRRRTWTILATDLCHRIGEELLATILTLELGNKGERKGTLCEGIIERGNLFLCRFEATTPL